MIVNWESSLVAAVIAWQISKHARLTFVVKFGEEWFAACCIGAKSKVTSCIECPNDDCVRTNRVKVLSTFFNLFAPQNFGPAQIQVILTSHIQHAHLSNTDTCTFCPKVRTHCIRAFSSTKQTIDSNFEHFATRCTLRLLFSDFIHDPHSGQGDICANLYPKERFPDLLLLVWPNWWKSS